MPGARTVSQRAELPRLPQLDGLRAVAVAMVVLAHIGFLLRISLSQRKALSPVIGADGVELFFVLSGYLITTILLRERARSGRISLGSFYLRRVLRIMPAFYAYLLVVAVLAWAGRADVTKTDLVAAAVYLWDYVPRTVPWIQHTWSLAIEEQFYLVWPLLLTRSRPRVAFVACVVGIVAAPVLRWATYGATVAHRADMTAHARADALLVGCAIAIVPVAFGQAGEGVFAFLRRTRLDLLGAAAYLLVVPYVISPYEHGIGSPATRLAIDLSIEAITGGLVLLVLLGRARSAFARLLGWGPLRHLGVISYSVYLWQQPFLLPTTHLPIPARVAGILAVSEVSHWAVERPFLRLKRRFERAGHHTAPAAVPALPGALP